MKMHSVKRDAKKDGICLKGFVYDGRFIIVALESEGQNTIVSVQVDVYGDEPLSKILLERMGSADRDVAASGGLALRSARDHRLDHASRPGH